MARGGTTRAFLASSTVNLFVLPTPFRVATSCIVLRSPWNSLAISCTYFAVSLNALPIAAAVA